MLAKYPSSIGPRSGVVVHEVPIGPREVALGARETRHSDTRWANKAVCDRARGQQARCDNTQRTDRATSSGAKGWRGQAWQHTKGQYGHMWWRQGLERLGATTHKGPERSSTTMHKGLIGACATRAPSFGGLENPNESRKV